MIFMFSFFFCKQKTADGVLISDWSSDVCSSDLLIIVAYVLGLGAAQLFWGPLADRFGRRRVLLAGVASYVLFSVAAALAGSFAMMIAARVMQGTSAAADRTSVV